MIQKAENKWIADMHFNIAQTGGNVDIDADKEVGGQGKGLLPKPMMLSALAGCTSMDVVSMLKKMRAEVKGFEVHVTGELTEEHPKIYHKVLVEYLFYGTDFQKDKIEKAVDLSVTRYCGVMEMFRKFSELTIEIKYIEQI
ncbi:MAG: OsmC family protein [Flavobacteriaceae bacterium]|nr:OsmC family protein [Flavobacteriaceae bacterium]